ncbi:acyltransferase family protein [Streptomyces sp. MI02-7b]|uniref:acyltransferase family protein n=1 Tax=Streptomyces sp. MI02-7b TaxID=462941 RepID=UPI0029A6CDBA|nr:acyltransferase family protein [Streptomyces sp. MI02-7b]MDX3073986.1 acyltransferase family protein [Streptomyces sp. MI02-7b]
MTSRVMVASRPPGASRSSDRHRYVPALDGLRAFAVAVVVVYHVHPAWLPGGFLGVDVFFVLSGFLITDLLITERAVNGSIDMYRFWVRRARRLLPSLALVLLAITAVSTALRPARTTPVPGALLSAAGFTNNWWQIATHTSYFATFGPLPSFQHLWTLSVEEQFYLLWPLVLVGLLLIRNRTASMAVVLVMAAASATWMLLLYRPGDDPSRVYFGTDTHAFPLLLGAALALARPALRGTAGRPARLLPLCEITGLLGLAVLLALAATVSQEDELLYPYGFLAAALATVSVLRSVLQRDGWPARLLSNALLRWIGKRSYGIYLWHLPLIALAAPDDAGSTRVPLRPIVAAALSVGFAAVSYRWVEQPVRRLGFRGAFREVLRSLAKAESSSRFRLVTARAAVAGAAATVLLASCGLATAPHSASTSSAAVAAGEAGLESDSSVPLSRRITAIGDSVMLAVAPALQRRFPGISIDANVGRQLRTAPDLLGTLKRNHSLGHTVIIGLGTNGLGGVQDLRAAIEEIGPERRLLIITVHAKRDWSRRVNVDIRQAADEHPRTVAVADWDRAVAGREDLLADDGIHPGPGGAKLYADTVAKALARLQKHGS